MWKFNSGIGYEGEHDELLQIYGLAPDPTEMGTVFLSEMRDLYAVMDSLSYHPGIDSENVYLWGHSLGGLTVAYACCDRTSEVRGLILVEPALVVGGGLDLIPGDTGVLVK